LVVETNGVLAGQIVVEFTTLWLHDVGLAGLSGVLNVVSVSTAFLIEQLLVVPS